MIEDNIFNEDEHLGIFENFYFFSPQPPLEAPMTSLWNQNVVPNNPEKIIIQNFKIPSTIHERTTQNFQIVEGNPLITINQNSMDIFNNNASSTQQTPNGYQSADYSNFKGVNSKRNINSIHSNLPSHHNSHSKRYKRRHPAKKNRIKSLNVFNKSLFSFIQKLSLFLGYRLHKVYTNQFVGSKKKDKSFLKKKIKIFYSQSRPKRVPKGRFNTHNKKIINKLYTDPEEEENEDKKEIRLLLMDLLELSIEEMYEYYIKDEKEICVFKDSIIRFWELKDFEKQYQCEFKTFEKDHERMNEDPCERELYVSDAKTLIKVIME